MSKENLSGIYIVKNIVNGKIYIGQGKNIYKRWIEHKWELKNKKHHNSYFQRSWDKYGEENFSFEIIEECELENLNDRETYWIRYYQSSKRRFGYNANDGGDSKKMNEETKEKIRISNTGKKRSPETCALIGNNHRGNKMSDEAKLKMRNAKLDKKQSLESIEKRVNSRKGYFHSEETRNKISKSNMGRTASPEFIAKMTGRKASDETKTKQSIARLGKEPWNKGKTGVYSDEIKKKMKDNQKPRRGEENITSKLKEHQIKEMMLMFDNKSKNQDVADYFGVSLSTVKDIKQGKNWKHITGYKSKKERNENDVNN